MDIYRKLLLQSATVPYDQQDILNSGKNVVNFLICSTFEDFEIERKILAASVFPKLRKECFEKFGIDIKLIDVNLGLDAVDELSSDYLTLFEEALSKYGICNEYNCPIILLGNKYGTPLIPPRIPVSIFRHFKATLRRHRGRFLIGPDALDVYYRLDHDNNDQMFLLGAREFFPGLTSQDSQEIQKCRNEWTEVKYILKEAFNLLYEICLKEGSLDKKALQALFIFELDAAVSHVIRNCRSGNIEQAPIVVSRQIVDVANFIGCSNRPAQRWRQSALAHFVDTTSQPGASTAVAGTSRVRLNRNSQALLDQLQSTVAEMFPESEDCSFRILWRDRNGVSEKDHSEYLARFEAVVSDRIRCEAGRRAQDGDWPIVGKDRPDLQACVDDVGRAGLAVRRLSSHFLGYEEVVAAMLGYVDDEDDSGDEGVPPMVLYGPVNSGKAVVFAKTCQELLNRHVNCLVLARFCRPEDQMETVLRGLLYQLSAVLLPAADFLRLVAGPARLLPLEAGLGALLQLVANSSSSQRPRLVLILHGLPLAQLGLPNCGLPPGVRVIVAAAAEAWVDRDPRHLNLDLPPHQQHALLLAQASLPAHNELITDVLSARLLHHCLGRLSDLTELSDMPELSRRLLHHVGIQFGPHSVLPRLLELLVAAEHGLTEQELADLLSADQEVMVETARVCPSGVLRPDAVGAGDEASPERLALGWLRALRLQLGPLLTETMQDGTVLLQLSGLLVGPLRPEAGQAARSLLADFYAEQALASPDSGGHNYRALREAALHLARSRLPRHRDWLNREIVFNFHWLYQAVSALGMAPVLHQLETASAGVAGQLLAASLRAAETALLRDGLDSLAGALIGPLLGQCERHPGLRALIATCDLVAPRHNALIPIYGGGKGAGGTAACTTISCRGSVDSALVTASGQLLLKLRDDDSAFFYHPGRGVVVSQLQLSYGAVFLGPNPDLVAVLAEGAQRQVVKLHNAKTGELVGQVIPLNWIVPRPFEDRQHYRVERVQLGRTRMLLVVSSLEVSSLLVIALDTPTLQPVLLYSPGQKLQLAALDVDANDEQCVFCHRGQRLVSLSIADSQLISGVELQAVPLYMSFARDRRGRRGFVVCERQRSVVVVELDRANSGLVTKCYKISLDNCLDAGDWVVAADPAKPLSSSGRQAQPNPLLLIRAKHSVLLYDWRQERVLCHVTRPTQLPLYFKLPNQRERCLSQDGDSRSGQHQMQQPVSLQFTAAQLIMQDCAVACALFRDIIICGVVHNRVLATLHAPVGGIVSDILQAGSLLIGRIDQGPDRAQILVWRTDAESGLFSQPESSQPDKLTTSVASIRAGPTVAVASACDSDEMGVFEVAGGQLVDLYSHAAVVQAIALSACGKWALVSVASDNNANILWSLDQRKIVMEFGSATTTVCISPLASSPGAFVVVSAAATGILEPNSVVTELRCPTTDTAEQPTMMQLTIAGLGFVEAAPFWPTRSERVMALLCRRYAETSHVGEEGVPPEPGSSQLELVVWQRHSQNGLEGISLLLTAADLAAQVGVDERGWAIEAAAGQMTDQQSLLVLCSCYARRRLCLWLDCTQEQALVTRYSELSSTLAPLSELRIGAAGLNAFDERQGAVIELDKGTVREINARDTYQDREEDNEEEEQWKFRGFALNDSVVLVTKTEKTIDGQAEGQLCAWRIPDTEETVTRIGSVRLADPVTYCVTRSDDDGTILVGLADGSVLSYAVVDGRRGNVVNRSFKDGSASDSQIDQSVQLPLPAPYDLDLGGGEDFLSELETVSNDEDGWQLDDPQRRPHSDPLAGLSRRTISDLF